MQIQNLHSNMVRFIIDSIYIYSDIKLFIYIPIWLDLLCNTYNDLQMPRTDLHSNMVRFIIERRNRSKRTN